MGLINRSTKDSVLVGSLVQKAEDLEARQARLVAAEAAALRQRADLEHAHSRHTAEASAAIGRLQAEFAHRLQLEQRRAEEVEGQRGAATAELEDAQVPPLPMGCRFHALHHYGKRMN